MVTIDEDDLHRRTICSWMPTPAIDELMGPAIGTLDWALQERYEGSVPTLPAIRARFVYLWQTYWGDKPQVGPEYWKGPKTAIRFGTRLYKFLLRYGCLRPFGTQSVEIGPGTIVCHSAIVEQAKARFHPEHAFALDVRVVSPKILYVPDYRGFARWLAMQTHSDSKLGLVHLPLLWGKDWQEMELDRDLVEKWLGSIMRQAEDLPDYPVAGVHCKYCPAPCKGVFLGPNDHYRKRRLTQVSGV